MKLTAADGAVTALGWDAGHRNTTASVSNSADPAQDASVAYARDASDRVVARATTTAAAGSSVLRYAFTGDGDTPDLVLDAGSQVLTRTIALPGGVLYDQPGQGAPPTTTTGGTSVPAAPSWSCPSIRGDIALLWTDAGIQTGPLHTYTPDGQPLTPTGVPDPDAGPDTQPGDTNTGWLGQHQKDLDHAGGLNLIQMGARPYTPLLARFLTTDPVEGGTPNTYTYVTDPINETDLDGQCARGQRSFWRRGRQICQTIKPASSSRPRYCARHKGAKSCGGLPPSELVWWGGVVVSGVGIIATPFTGLGGFALVVAGGFMRDSGKPPRNRYQRVIGGASGYVGYGSSLLFKRTGRHLASWLTHGVRRLIN